MTQLGICRLTSRCNRPPSAAAERPFRYTEATGGGLTAKAMALFAVLASALAGCSESRTTTIKAIAEPITAEVGELPSGLVTVQPLRCIQEEVTGADAPDGPRYITQIGFFEREGDGIRILGGGIRNDRPEPVNVFVDVELVSGGRTYKGWAFGGTSTPRPDKVPVSIAPGQDLGGNYPVTTYRSLKHLYQPKGLSSCRVYISEATKAEVENGRGVPKG